METITPNANPGFIFCSKCEMCGGTDEADAAYSELIIRAGYGSRYDGRHARLTICGKCVDTLAEYFDIEDE